MISKIGKITTAALLLIPLAAQAHEEGMMMEGVTAPIAIWMFFVMAAGHILLLVIGVEIAVWLWQKIQENKSEKVKEENFHK